MRNSPKSADLSAVPIAAVGPSEVTANVTKLWFGKFWSHNMKATIPLNKNRLLWWYADLLCYFRDARCHGFVEYSFSNTSLDAGWYVRDTVTSWNHLVRYRTWDYLSILPPDQRNIMVVESIEVETFATYIWFLVGKPSSLVWVVVWFRQQRILQL